MWRRFMLGTVADSGRPNKDFNRKKKVFYHCLFKENFCIVMLFFFYLYGQFLSISGQFEAIANANTFSVEAFISCGGWIGLCVCGGIFGLKDGKMELMALWKHHIHEREILKLRGKNVRWFRSSRTSKAGGLTW